MNVIFTSETLILNPDNESFLEINMMLLANLKGGSSNGIDDSWFFLVCNNYYFQPFVFRVDETLPQEWLYLINCGLFIFKTLPLRPAAAFDKRLFIESGQIWPEFGRQQCGKRCAFGFHKAVS